MGQKVDPIRNVTASHFGFLSNGLIYSGSITSFTVTKPSTITKKIKPEVIEIDADEIPTRLMIVTTEKDGRLVDVEVGVAKKKLAG